jgi:hypothetical protein
MNPVTFLLVAVAGATVNLSIAPDQPVAHVYVDDPLIIEFKSDQDVAATVDLDIEPDYAASPVRLPLGPIRLRAHSAHWHAVEGIPGERGRYRVRARVDTGGGATETTATFCRIDRPPSSGTLPVCLGLGSFDPGPLLAAQAIAIRQIRLNAGNPDLAAQVNEAAAQGFQVVLALDAGQAEACEAMAKTFGDRVARWDVDPGGAAEGFGAMAKALRRSGTKSPIALVVNDAQAVGAALAAGFGPLISAVMFRNAHPERSDLAEVRAAAERAGYEGMVLDVVLPADAGDDPQRGPRVSRQILTHLGASVGQTEIDAAQVYEKDFGPGYAYLSALAHRMKGTEYVGELALGGGIQALVYRAGDWWTIAVWGSDGPKEARLKIEDAAELALFDGRNNPLPVPALTEGAVTLRVTGEPQFLCGKAGSVVAQAAWTTARKRAAFFVEQEDFKKAFPAETLDLVRKFATLETAGYTRMDFLNLLKLFPAIEKLWHTGSLSRSVAVPALASLSRLARSLCIVEQERGEPFLEPLQSTLADCGRLQSLYLTSSAGSSESRERPDWLLDEVGRLMTQAERLAEEGRKIEASAVAALADWRANALEIAVTAQPLSIPEKPPQPPEAAPPPKTQEKPAPPPAHKDKKADTKTRGAPPKGKK